MKRFLALCIAVLALFGSVAVADYWETDGTVYAVFPVDSETVEIVVETDDGDLYSYFDSSVVCGRVHLLFDDDGKIIDVISYSALSAPF